MRRFEILNPQGERVGEGVEWSDGRVDVRAKTKDLQISDECYPNIDIARAAFAKDGSQICYTDPGSKAEAVMRRLAEQNIAMGARRTEHRFQVTTGTAGNGAPKEPRKLPSEWIAERDNQQGPPPFADSRRIERRVEAVIAYLDEQAREREGSG